VGEGDGCEFGMVGSFGFIDVLRVVSLYSDILFVDARGR
jgi:hypothetical protein